MWSVNKSNHLFNKTQQINDRSAVKTNQLDDRNFWQKSDRAVPFQHRCSHFKVKCFIFVLNIGFQLLSSLRIVWGDFNIIFCKVNGPNAFKGWQRLIADLSNILFSYRKMMLGEGKTSLNHDQILVYMFALFKCAACIKCIHDSVL